GSRPRGRRRPRTTSIARKPRGYRASAVADPLSITVLEGDETGQELLDAALRVFDPDLLGLEIELDRHSLSLERRRETDNGVVHEAAAAMRASGLGIKAGTITPEGRRRRVAQPDPARGGRRQGHHPHRPPDPGRHAGRRRP